MDKRVPNEKLLCAVHKILEILRRFDNGFEIEEK